MRMAHTGLPDGPATRELPVTFTSFQLLPLHFGLSLIQPFSAAGPCPQPVGYAREGSRSNCQSERR